MSSRELDTTHDEGAAAPRESRVSPEPVQPRMSETTADGYGALASAQRPVPPADFARASTLMVVPAPAVLIGEPGLPKPGELVAGRYRIEDELGRGGMGVVYAATQLGSDRRIAVKWLFEGTTNREERRRRFLREARAASSIEHANVVRVFDAGEHRPGVYLAMERLTGASLRVHLQSSNMGVTEAVDLLMPALRGIEAAHRKGVVHRDLKPDNLLVCPRGPGIPPDIKVLDFGLSKLVGPGSDSLHTLPGAMLGTPQYMAPEQVDGRGGVDVRSDIYSIAVILYEAIAGRRPFEALTLPQLLEKLSRHEPPSLGAAAKAVGKKVPRAFERVVMRALQRDPAARFASIEELAVALEPFSTIPFHTSPASRAVFDAAHPLGSMPPARSGMLDALRERRLLTASIAFALVALGALGYSALRRARDAGEAVPIALPAQALPAQVAAAPVPAAAAPVMPIAPPAPPAPLPLGVSSPSALTPAPEPPRQAGKKPARPKRRKNASDESFKLNSGIVDPWEAPPASAPLGTRR
jgi:hypothetical protein